MKIKLEAVMLSMMLLSVGVHYTYADTIYANIGIEQKTKILNDRMKLAQTDPKQVPMTLISAGYFKGHNLDTSLIVTSDVNGEILIEDSVIGQDLIIASKNLTKISIKNSTIKGDIYVVDSSRKTKIDVQNGKVGNIYVASPVSISEKGSKAEIYNIILTKHIKKGTNIYVDAYVQKLVNYAEGINVYFKGEMNILSVNKKFNFASNVGSYKKKISNDYSFADTVVYDLSDMKTTKGYKNITDNTSYQDMYNRLKAEQYTGAERISMIVKNPSDTNLKNTNEVISEQISKFLPNNSAGFYTTSFNDARNSYGIYNIFFLYDTSSSMLKQANKVVDTMYDSIKNLDGVEYIRAVNKLIGQNIVYDETLTRHSLYDATINKNSVCDGYAKLGYELLSKKFGRDNNILIANKDHIWNMIRLYGKWYHIDFTHNDPVTRPLDKNNYTEDYLLVSDTRLKQLSQDRTWDTNIYPKANESINLTKTDKILLFAKK